MWMLPHRTIYMDGRARPSPNAQHSWQGFSTGEWEGDMLKVTTTHLKEGWVRRNGVPRSDKATLVEYFIRHGDYLTLVTVVKDPVYLTEAFVRTSNWVLDPGFQLSPFSCIPTIEIERPRGAVPHHLPGTNAYLGRVRRQTRHSVRRDARRRRDDVSGLHGAVAPGGGAMTTAHRMALALFVCCGRRRGDGAAASRGPARAGQRVRDRRAGRQHHRADRPRRAARRGYATGGVERSGARRDPVADARSRSGTSC